MRKVSVLLMLFAMMLLAPAIAQAAKVTETAPGVAVPDSFDSGGIFTAGEASQAFKLKGSKVKGKQILDVNVILNGTSAVGTSSLAGVRVKLIGPKGDETDLPQLQNVGLRDWADLKVDDQSLLFGCDPQDRISSRCNYVQNGTITGSIHGILNPVFRGGNPKGTWRLLFRDRSFSPPGQAPTSIGTTTLEVKTGKKFAKERK
jgi:hypothetical protein